MMLRAGPGYCLSFLALALLMTQEVSSANGQTSDFDSLLQHNMEYSQFIQSAIDTFDLFAREDPLKLKLESDFRNLVKNKGKGNEQPAVLSLLISDSVTLRRFILIKPRGGVRKNVCFFPPLMLCFSDNDSLIRHITGSDKLKMVIRCNRSKINEQYLLSEYYAYKLFNLLTPISFRVRLVEYTFVDTGGRFRPDTGYAFIIENIEQMAYRLNAVPFEYEKISDKYINHDNLSLVYLFQYLIGNTDWSIPAGHNIKMIRSKDPLDSLPYVVPYDFDYAGIVNADYAAPDASLGLSSVRERRYRGFCVNENLILKARKHYYQAESDIEDLYGKESLLDKPVRFHTLEYISEFYQIIRNDFMFRTNVLSNCR